MLIPGVSMSGCVCVRKVMFDAALFITFFLRAGLLFQAATAYIIVQASHRMIRDSGNINELCPAVEVVLFIYSVGFHMNENE